MEPRGTLLRNCVACFQCTLALGEPSRLYSVVSTKSLYAHPRQAMGERDKERAPWL